MVEPGEGVVAELPADNGFVAFDAALVAACVGEAVAEGPACDDAVSDNFIDEVSALADQVDGDPDALLEEVPDIHGFGSHKTEKLQNCLRDEGYLDPYSTRPDEQIRSAVVDTYCQHGLEPTTAATTADRLLSRISANSEPSETTD